MDDNCLMLDETLMLSPLPRYLRFSEPGTYFRNPGSGGGWCAGAALGAKLGRPDKDVVTVTGDGFYMYSVPNIAIASAVRYKAPFMSIIYQNRSYSTGTQRNRLVLSGRLCGEGRARGRLFRSADRFRQGGGGRRRLWRERQGPGPGRHRRCSADSITSARARRR